MKRALAFLGPSIDRAARLRLINATISDQVEIAPPARFGDIARAMRAGYRTIILIDGVFGEAAPPRHKEILYALSHGVTVIGAASLGALRACECAAFGMVGIGSIFEAYRDGRLSADDAVAILHGPSELGYCGLTDALVTIDANMRILRHEALIDGREFDAIMDRARGLHFSQRHAVAIMLECISGNQDRKDRIERELAERWFDPKADDALHALRYAATLPYSRPASARDWVFADTQYALEYLGQPAMPDA